MVKQAQQQANDIMHEVETEHADMAKSKHEKLLKKLKRKQEQKQRHTDVNNEKVNKALHQIDDNIQDAERTKRTGFRTTITA